MFHRGLKVGLHQEFSQILSSPPADQQLLPLPNSVAATNSIRQGGGGTRGEVTGCQMGHWYRRVTPNGSLKWPNATDVRGNR
eukprot:1182559-Prorocentrum_minimum.AAC.3